MGQYYKTYIKFENGTEESYCSQDAIYMTRNGLHSTSEIKEHSYDRSNPNSWGNCFSGIKLMEHSWMDNDFVNGIVERITGRSAQVAWVGDYSDALIGEVEGFTEDVYRKMWHDGDDCLPELPFPAEPSIHKYGFLVNHSQGIFMDMEAYYTENVADDSYWGERCVHPLPLLTAIGNGYGGGDYFSKVGIDDVGTWALDEIEYTYEKPDRPYCEVMYRFDSNA